MITIALRTLLIYIILNVTLRILGKRQIGELEIPELVTTLLLSELATAVICDPKLPLYHSLIPVFLITVFELSVSAIKNKSALLKKFFDGSPGVLIRRGVLDQTELKRMRVSVEELLAAFRLQGIVSIADVYYAILEQNGQLSVILRKECQQPNAKELGLPSKETGISHAIVVDGQIKREELCASGMTDRWLQNTLAAQAVPLSEIFLLAVDDGGNVVCIPKEKPHKRKRKK